MNGGGGPPGNQFRDYRIVEEISRGGQGVVYKALHGPSGRGVALKLLTDPQEEAVKRFKQEARVLSRLSHPHVLQVFEYGEQEGVPFLAIEYVDGQDLKGYVKAQGLPPPQGVARVMATVAYTIHYCHGLGVIHRDLKPENVLIENGSGRPVVIDFGLVKRDPHEMHLASLDKSVMSKSGSVKGTPEYMAPEQVNPSEFGEVSPRSDVYGLGATLYYLLTGSPPFQGGAVVVVFRKVTRKAPVDPRQLNPAVPPALAELCLRCLAKQPAERPESAEVLAALLCEAGGVQVPVPTPRAPSQQRLLASSSGSHATLAASSGRHKILPARLPAPGEAFAGCTIERELGRGGAGAVYSAIRPDAERVAIKVVLGDVTSAEKRERFLREAQVGWELDHPAVVKVHTRGEERGLAFLIMDLVEDARTLSNYVREEGVSVPGRVHLMLQVAEALEAAHKADLIHRDLKPDNVVVTRDGQVKVLDFGLARHLDKERLTMSGAVMGTVHYMAPEQVLGRAYEAGPATDVWAMGVMLYELIKGELPFEGATNIEIMAGIVDSEPADPCAGVTDAPKGLSAVIRMCLAKDPKKRYPNAAAFGRDLVAATSGSGSISAQRVLAARDRKRALGRLLVAALVAGGLVAGAAFAVQRFSKLSERDLKERFADLDERARSFVRESTPGLEEEGAAVATLQSELEAVLGRAARDPGAQRVAKLRARLRAVEGLIALAGGEEEAALAAVEGLDDAETPEAGALRGGVAAVISGDPVEAVRLLSRAIARGFARPELRAWRLMATARGGITTPAEADLVLGDARVLERSQGSLSAEQVVARARAHLVLDQLDQVEAALGQLKDPPMELVWTVGFRRAEPFLEREPGKAFELLRDVSGTPPAAIAQGSTFLERLHELLLALLRRKVLDEQARVQARSLVDLAARLVPRAALSEEEVAGLLKHTTDFRVTGDSTDRPVRDLALALTRACPDDADVQTRVAQTTFYASPLWVREFFPVLTRAIELQPAGIRRDELRLLYMIALARVCWRPGQAKTADAEKALALATELEPKVSDEQLPIVLGGRAGGLFILGEFERALADLERALEQKAEPLLALSRGRVRQKLGQDLGGAFEDGLTFLLSDSRGGHETVIALLLTWELRAERPPARRVMALEAALTMRPQLGGWWVRLAEAQLLAGSMGEVSKSLERAMRGYSEVPVSWGGFVYPAAIVSETQRTLRLFEDGDAGAAEALRGLVKMLEEERLKGRTQLIP